MRALSSYVLSVAAMMGATSLLACSSVQESAAHAVLSDASIRVVTAREAGGGRGPIGISDRFTTDGTVVAFVSLVWPADHTTWGTQTFESRWYSGDRLVVKRDSTYEIGKSPFNFFSSVFPVNLGPGPARYELYAGGRKVAEKTFEIASPMAPSAPGRLGRPTPAS